MSVTLSTLFVASLALLSPHWASGFAPQPSFGIARRSACLYVAVVDESGDVPNPPVVHNAWLYEDSTDSFDYNMPQNAFELAASITQNQLAQLARLAVAFSPPAQQLAIQNINEVQVLSVNEKSIEIEAVVCDEEQCVTLAVPVAFPIACETVEDKDCILDNIDQLGMQADFKIQEQDQATALEQDEEHSALQQQLSSRENLSLPPWWVAAGALQGSCDTMRGIVTRKDFADDIKELAIRQLQTNLVEEATVVTICPTGMYLRASVSGHGLADLVVPFQQQALDDNTLKSAVLDAVTGAQPVVQAQPGASAADLPLEQQLLSPDQLHFPNWWVPAQDMTKAWEDVCSQMLQAMNQADFQNEVRALAMHDLTKNAEDGVDYVIEQAAVVSVCPSGLYVRAVAKPVEILEEHPARIVDITLQFEYRAESVEHMQSAVLGLVAAAAAYSG